MNSGLLLIDKRPGMTSFDVIRDLKRSLGRTDLGHGGTLDKFASGLLPVFFGEGLKLVRFFQEHHPELSTHWKSYSAEVFLGRSTETGDPEGETTAEIPAPESIDEKVVKDALQFFTKEVYLQTPPQYSAKKVDGNRASDLARKGQTVELKPVPVVIRRIECTDWSNKHIRFSVECSKGTYVRVLAEDIAKKIGTVGHLTSLRRTSVGVFSVTTATPLEEISKETLSANKSVFDLNQACSFLDKITLLPHEALQIENGSCAALITRLMNSNLKPNAYCAVDSTGKPRALLNLDSERVATLLRGFKN